MPTEKEYDAIFSQNVIPILQSGYNNMREARHILARANAATISKRRELTQGITDAWKEGFKKLKEENDQMQRDLVLSFKGAMQMNNEWLSDASEGLQK